MPVVSLSAITGKDVPSLIESLERQRKELEFILSSLDNDNVLELNGGLINQGMVQAQFVAIGSETTFEDGYDPTGTTVSGKISKLQADVDAIESEVDTLQSVVSSMETSVATSQGDIDAIELELDGIPQQISDAKIIDSVTSDPVSPVIGQVWLRSDL
jgi:chromosome segregation ATPase